MGWLLVVVVALTVAAVLLREPVREVRARRAERAQERKRQWRRDRAADRDRRSRERAMNPAKAARRRGAPRWQQVAARQGTKCWLCGTRTYDDDRQRTAVGTEQPGDTYPVVDFVRPPQDGGYLDDNVRLAHRRCAQVRAANPARTTYGSPARTFG